MTSLYIGFISILAVVFFSIGKDSASNLIQGHSIVIVFAGTVAVLLFSTPNSVLKSLYKSILELFHKEKTIQSYEEELKAVNLAKGKKSNSTNELISYGSELWVKGVAAELFIVLLSQKKREIESKRIDAIHSLKNLSKYPPALGMVGTVLGMIALFTSLDSNRSEIGSHLSLSMTATFFGLILSNGLIAPLADRLQLKHVQEQRVLESIYEILLLVNSDEATALVNEEVSQRAA
jgi:chemotaxis protein MotA